MPEPQTDAEKIYRTTITTNRGTIVMDLDPQLAPATVNNFVGLARKGYYDGLTFHRVVPDFVIQGGCPEGSGRGGPGYRFADEPVKGEYTLGAVAMANAGPDTNGSQFFICIDDCRRKLTPNYNLFGHVVEGIDVAQAFEIGSIIDAPARPAHLRNVDAITGCRELLRKQGQRCGLPVLAVQQYDADLLAGLRAAAERGKQQHAAKQQHRKQ